MNKASTYEYVLPEPESLLQSSRAFGYSLETAIADIVDNSITAKANSIKITYGIDQYSSFLRIEDDGYGMSEKELVNAMRIGSFNPLNERASHDLGRFGLGLKTASFSQCRRLTVKTIDKSGKTFVRCWDLDLIAEKKRWILFKVPIDKRSSSALGEITGATGTVILWEKLDRLIEHSEGKLTKQHFYRKLEIVNQHLSLVFHRFLNDKKIHISVGGDSLAAIDPFHISEEIPSTELPEEYLSIQGHSIKIQPYILPHESKLKNSPKNGLVLTKGWNEHQGIFLYRNERLISDGGWLDLGFQKKESQRLCRIKIDISNALDKEWHIDVKKASAKIPDIIRKQIKNICFSAIEKAIKVYTHRGAYIKRRGQKKEVVYLWKTVQRKGKRFYEINELHPIYQLISDYLEAEAYVFKDYVKLVAECLPISFIVADFSDPTVIMKGFFEETTNELQSIYSNTINALIKSGMQPDEAVKKANTLDYFQKLNIN